MKAVLVIDMPDGVEAEDYYMVYGLFANKGEKPFRVEEVAFECKEVDLRPLPQKLDANDWHRMFSGKHDIREAKGYGWNVCRDVITGETE